MNLEIVSHELTSAEFVLKTQQQIVKDFGTAGIDFPEDFQTHALDLNQLLSTLSIRLKELDTMNPSGFSQLMYQIDVPESVLSDLSTGAEFYVDLAEFVLKREAYKVFLRKKFS